MRRLLSMGSSAVAVGASLVAKSVLLLAVSAYAYANLQDRDVVVFFQLLFLQGVIVTFVSAAGFFGAMGSDADPHQDRARLAASLKLALLAAAVLALLPAVYSFGAPLAAYVLVCLGGMATGISAPLSGLTARERGYWSAFGPAVVTSVLPLPLLFLLPTAPLLMVYGAIVAAQISYLVWLAFLNHALIRRAPPPDRASAVSTGRGEIAALVYGSLNTATLLTILHVREAWSHAAAPALVAAVFFALRISDTGLQVLTMVLVPAVKRLLAKRARLAMFAKGALSSAVLGLAVIVLSPALADGSWMFVVAALVGLELIRLPSSLAFVVQMVRRTPIQYAVYVGVSSAVGLAIFHFGSPTWPALLHLTLGAMSLSALIVTLIGLRLPSLANSSPQSNGPPRPA